MVVHAFVLLGALYGSGVANAPAVLPAGDRDTLPLVASESVVFLGFSGDFAGEAEVRFQEMAGQELGLALLGSPVRSLSDRCRLVWAARTSDAEGIAKKLARPLKEKGYQVTLLRATVFSVLGNPSSAEVQRGLRTLDRSEKRLWACFLALEANLIWLFHEPRLTSARLLDAAREADLKVAFYHQELELEAKEEADVEMLARQASQKLDLLRAGSREKHLVLDVYLRDLPSLLALERGKKVSACPDVLAFLRDVPAGRLSWVVTLDNRGYPFVD